MMRFRCSSDEGAIAVTMSVLLIVLIGFAALVVDVGYWYNVRRQLQAAADAAALAGCEMLILEKSNAEIIATAQVYAEEHNAKAPADGLTMKTAAPWTEVGADYVKVTVEKTAPRFFARIWGDDDQSIAAQAIARIGYMSGARSPLPWAVPILNVTRATATVGGIEVELSKDASGHWVGSLPSDAEGTVAIRAYNDQTVVEAGGIHEEVPAIGYVAPLDADARILAVETDAGMYEPGETVNVRVLLDGPLGTGEKLELTGGAVRSEAMSASGVTPDEYVGSFTAPATDALQEPCPFEVELVDKKAIDSYEGKVVVRRSTFPIADVAISPALYSPGGAPWVDVRLNEYEYGHAYTLKVSGGGAEVGNFMAVDYAEVYHPPAWDKTKSSPEYDFGSDAHLYEDFVAGTLEPDRSTPPFVLHLGDTVYTLPGGKTGPSMDGLSTRLGASLVSFSAWDSAGRPPSRQVVYLPVTEKLDFSTGQSALRVVSFAMFFIDDFDDKDKVVSGVFVEYTTAPGGVTGTPPASLAIPVARLVKDSVAF